MPTIPNGAFCMLWFLSCCVWGAWSVAMTSMISSFNPGTISSVDSVKWCGQTSAVTGSPSAFASFTMVTLSFVEQWQRCSLAPVSFAKIISLAMITSSTELVIPASPCFLVISSAFTTPPWTKWMSSQCANTGILHSAAIFIASLYKSVRMTDLPSSLIAGLPAWTMPLISASSSPCCPFVTAPTCKTLVSPSLSAFLCTYDTTSALSTTGFVFGIAKIVV